MRSRLARWTVVVVRCGACANSNRGGTAGTASVAARPVDGAEAPSSSPAPNEGRAADLRPPVVAGADGGTAPAAGCPAQQPAERAPCTSPELRCTYAGSPSCGSIWACYTGEWRVLARGSCEPGDTCPATAAARRPAAAARAASNMACVYDEGLVCAYRHDQLPCSGAVRPLRANDQPRWRCERPGPTGCVIGVRAGERCAEEGLTCGGGCCSAGHRCVKGRWTGFFSPCPP